MQTTNRVPTPRQHSAVRLALLTLLLRLVYGKLQENG